MGIRKTLLISGYYHVKKSNCIIFCGRFSVIVRTNQGKTNSTQRRATQCGGAEEQMENEQNRNHSGKNSPSGLCIFDTVFLYECRVAIAIAIVMVVCIYCMCVWLLFSFFRKCEVSLSANYCIWCMREYKWWSPFVWLWAVRKLLIVPTTTTTQQQPQPIQHFGSGCIGFKPYFMQRSYSCFFIWCDFMWKKYRLYSSSFNRPKYTLTLLHTYKHTHAIQWY